MKTIIANYLLFEIFNFTIVTEVGTKVFTHLFTYSFPLRESNRCLLCITKGGTIKNKDLNLDEHAVKFCINVRSMKINFSFLGKKRLRREILCFFIHKIK